MSIKKYSNDILKLLDQLKTNQIGLLYDSNLPQYSSSLPLQNLQQSFYPTRKNQEDKKIKEENIYKTQEEPQIREQQLENERKTQEEQQQLANERKRQKEQQAR